MRRRLAMLIFAAFLLPSTASAQAKATVTKESGGSVKTVLSASIAVNRNSSLLREWIAVHHPTFPADLVGTPGVTTIFVPDQLSGEYRYKAKVAIEAKEPLAAIQIRFLVFDVWGQHIKTLSSTDVVDIEPGKKEFEPQWRIFPENEVSEFYASIAYIARVKTKTGHVVTADVAPVLNEARRFSTKFTVDDLEPKPEKK